MVENRTQSAIQRVKNARHPERPYMLDYVERLFKDFTEFHGDRRFANDTAVICGFATYHGVSTALIGQQKGRDTNQRRLRNFGMPKPEGYRKAIRFMNLAAKFGCPIITFYSVISPEGCAAILWKDATKSFLAAEGLKLTAQELLQLGIIDDIVGEPGEGAHTDHDIAAQMLDAVLSLKLDALRSEPLHELRRRRYEKIRRLGSL